MQRDTNNTRKIRLLLADDCKIMCEGLHLLFERQPDVEVICAETSVPPLQLVHELKPDIVVISLDMPGADNIGLCRQILNEDTGVRIVALRSRPHAHILEQAVKTGISGLVLKECGFGELVRAVRAVSQNQTYICPEIKDIIANGHLAQISPDEQPESSALTDREYEIVRLLSLGMTSKEIAIHMGVSSKTIDASRRKIMEKLGINSIAELVKHAIRVGLATV